MKIRINSQFIKSLAVLASGSMLAQLIIIIASPIMTRLYSPEQIGEYTLVLTVVGLFGSIICARYDLAIVSESDEDNVISLCALSLVISFFSSIIISIAYLAYYFTKGFSTKQSLFCCFCIFILLILQGLGNVLLSYNNRCREYKLMTSVNLIRAVAKEVVMVVGGLIYPSSSLLIVSEIIGTTLGVRRQSKTLRTKIDGIKNIRVSKDNLKKVGLKHKKQALFSTPALFANNFSYSSINLFIDSLFGTAALGFYSISYRLLGLPLTIVSSNVSRIYFEEASRATEKQGNYFHLFKRTVLVMVAIAIPMTVVLMAFAPPVCGFVFGKQYFIAGVYLRCLAPMFGVRFVISPLSVGLIISEKQHYDFAFQLAFVVLSVIAFIITKVSNLMIEQYLIIISCLYSIVYVVFFFVLMTFARGEKTLR